MSCEQNRRAAAWSMEIVQPCRHQRRSVCLFTHSSQQSNSLHMRAKANPISFFSRPRYCVSKIRKCILHARECSFWCIWVIWPEIIEFIMMGKVWIFYSWFSCEDNFSRISAALNLGSGQCVLYMHESKHFNCILAIILAMASSGASGGKTSDRQAVGIECSWFCTGKLHSMTH